MAVLEVSEPSGPEYSLAACKKLLSNYNLIVSWKKIIGVS